MLKYRIEVNDEVVPGVVKLGWSPYNVPDSTDYETRPEAERAMASLLRDHDVRPENARVVAVEVP